MLLATECKAREAEPTAPARTPERSLEKRNAPEPEAFLYRFASFLDHFCEIHENFSVASEGFEPPKS